MNKARLGTALILALASAAFGGSRTAALPAAFDLKIAVFETAPKIDGVLEPEIWDAATRMESFTQYLPTEGAAPSEQTIGYIGCDRDSLYSGLPLFRFQSPGRPRQPDAARPSRGDDASGSSSTRSTPRKTPLFSRSIPGESRTTASIPKSAGWGMADSICMIATGTRFSWRTPG